MGILTINCGYCGGSWEVYSRDMKYDKARTCPHCLQSIEQQTWDKQILPAFGMLDDANRELFKDHTGYHKTLFSVSYEPDIIFKNAERAQMISISGQISRICGKYSQNSLKRRFKRQFATILPKGKALTARFRLFYGDIT